MKDGLATSLSTYVDHVLFSFTHFYVDIQLTDLGVEKYQEVIKRLWAQIKQMKDEGAQEYIFNDYQKISEVNWRFLEKGSYTSYTSWLAHRMQIFNSKNVDNILSSAYLISQFSTKEIDSISNMIYDVNNCNIYLSSKIFEGKTDLTEKWYGTQFSKEPISDGIISEMYSGDLYKDLALPQPNPYLPNNFDLFEKNEEYSKVPVKAKDESSSVVWYKKDDKFDQPKCTICLRIYKKKNYLCDDHDPLKEAFNCLWSDVYDELLREVRYRGNCVSLSAKVTNEQDYLQLSFSGYNDSLLKYLSDVLVELLAKPDEGKMRDIFRDVKEQFVKNNKNFYYQAPYMQMSEYRSVLLFDKIHSPSDMLATDIDFDKFYQMCNDNLKGGKFEWFITGNMTKDQALKIADESEKLINNNSGKEFELLTHSNDLVHIHPVQIDKNTTLNYVIDSKDKDNVNSCVFSYFQYGEESLKLKILNEVAFQYLNEPTFNQLRTKEQLGYIASSFNVPIRLICGGGFIIQSTVGSPEFLISRINSFLDTHREEVKKVTDDYFLKMISSVVERKKQKDLNLRDETGRLAYEIFSHQNEFDRKDKEIELLNSLEKGEFIKYFYDLFYNEPRRMNIHLLAQNHKDNQLEFKTVNEEYYAKHGISNTYIGSIHAFKANAKYYPDLYKITEKFKSKI